MLVYVPVAVKRAKKQTNTKKNPAYNLSVCSKKIRKEIQETFSVQMHYVQVVLNKFTVPT